MNQGIFSGNIGRDAKTGTAGQNNTPYLSFPLGVNIGYGENQRTLWVGCTMWGKRADGRLIEHLGKGSKVVVQGEIDLDIYQKGDGTQGATVTLRVTELELMDGKPNATAGAAPTAQKAPASQPAPVDTGFDDDDDIPFRQIPL